MARPTDNLKVLRIPCQDSPLGPIPVQLIDLGTRGIGKDECSAFEKELGHIPDIQSIADPTEFSWVDRRLIGISVKDVPGYWTEMWQVDYMMYMCLEARAGLPSNKCLNRILEESDVEFRAAPNISAVYGDAFVFIKEPKSSGCDESDRAKYKNMHENFVLSAKFDGLAKELLHGILVNPTIGDLK